MDITDTYTYTYDTAGNILSETKTSGGTTTSKTYTYGNANWRDLLTKVGNTTISYDSNGDLKTYYNGDKTYTNLTWQHGRQLTSITVDGAAVSYAYDLDGIRTQKLVDGVIHSYVTQNGKVVRESFPYGDTTIIMDFIYDEAGRPFCVSYSKNGGTSYTNYFYAVNAQGDVEGIFRVIKNDDTGLYEQKWYGRYVYDAWGNVTATTATGGNPSATSLIVRNPIRYRGYVYDTETGFYYLQSRYYDPVTHRFINADSYASTGQGITGTNMFAYCLNNPVMCADQAGSIAGTWQMSVLHSPHGGEGVFMGAAEAYWGNEISQEELTNINCLGYILHLREDVGIHGYMPEKFSNTPDDVERLADLLGQTLDRYGYTIRPLDTYYSPIEANEYRFAMRLGKNDYHFMVQHSDGTWSHKSGDAPPQLLNVRDPGSIPWNRAVVTYYNGIVVDASYNIDINYYDSMIVYFAISIG